MPAFSASQIPPPKNWQEFETLCWDLWRRIWNDPNAQKNGRSGQAQFGVDVSGQRGVTWLGLQAKGKDNFTDQRVQSVSWLAEASRAADYMTDHLFEAHRGALLWCPDVSAVFGNDGYDPGPGRAVDEGNERARAEVKLVREKLREAGINELGFGKSGDGYSWVILVESVDTDRLFEMVWGCYPPGGSNNTWQKNEAFVKLRSYACVPVKPHCSKG